MAKFQPGQSGNPSGRPPKSKALADLLEATLSKTIETDNGKVAGKRVLASLVVEAATTGKVKFPGDKDASILGMKDWLEFVKWVYQYLEPPAQRTEITGAEGGAIKQETVVEIKGVDYRTVAAKLAPGSIPDSDAPGENQNPING